MQELVANTTDGAIEKHVPAVSVEENTVNVVIGSVIHPMTEEHYIQFIASETKQGVQIKYLKPGEAPQASFVLSEGDELVYVYEYCNLHGLWRA
jgi:superoxide reductase